MCSATCLRPRRDRLGPDRTHFNLNRCVVGHPGFDGRVLGTVLVASGTHPNVCEMRIGVDLIVGSARRRCDNLDVHMYVLR